MAIASVWLPASEAPKSFGRASAADMQDNIRGLESVWSTGFGALINSKSMGEPSSSSSLPTAPAAGALLLGYGLLQQWLCQRRGQGGWQEGHEPGTAVGSNHAAMGRMAAAVA